MMKLTRLEVAWYCEVRTEHPESRIDGTLDLQVPTVTVIIHVKRLSYRFEGDAY